MITNPNPSAGETAVASSKSFTPFFSRHRPVPDGTAVVYFRTERIPAFHSGAQDAAFRGAVAFQPHSCSRLHAAFDRRTHFLVGLSLLNQPLRAAGVVIMGAFMVNSLAFHIFLEHSGLPMAAIFTALELYLAWAYRRAFRPLLTARYDR